MVGYLESGKLGASARSAAPLLVYRLDRQGITMTELEIYRHQEFFRRPRRAPEAEVVLRIAPPVHSRLFGGKAMSS